MAIKYAENTSYNPIPSVDYRNLIKTLTTKAEERLKTTLANKKKIESPIVKNISQFSNLTSVEKTGQREAINAFADSGVPVSSYMGEITDKGKDIPPGTPLGQYKSITGVPYGTIVDPASKPYLETAKFLKPSEVTPKATFETLTRGGTYLKEPSKPGQGIATERGPLDYKENELIRQGLNPQMYQIDHISPLWAGGVDTMQNKEILSNFQHDIKTRIQAVPYTLMAHGLISQREALSMATEWKSKADTWGADNIPEPSSKSNSDTGEIVGMLDVKTAQKIAKEWTKPPKTTIKSFLASIPEAQTIMSKKANELVSAVLPKSKDTAIFREFGKGLVSGAIPGASFAMPQLDVNADYGDSLMNTASKVSHALGSIVGNLTLFGAAYKLAVKGLAKAGFEWAAKDIDSELLRVAAKQGVGALEASTQNKAIKAALARTAERKAAETAATEKALISSSGEEVSNKTIPSLIRGISPTTNYIKNILPKAATLGVVSTAIGQTRPQMEDQSRMERAMWDFAYGLFGPVGQVPYTVKGYASVATPSLVISLLEGQKPTDAFVNAMTMVGMHATGQIGNAMAAKGKSLESGVGQLIPLTAPGEPSKKYGTKSLWGTNKEGKPVIVTVAPKVTTAADSLHESANRLSLKWNEIKDGEMLSDVKSGSIKPEEFGTTLAELESFKYKKLSSDEIALDRHSTVLSKYFEVKGSKERWSNETIAREKMKVLASGGQLFKGGMNVVARNRKDLLDLVSMADRMKKKTDPDHIVTPSEIDNLAKNLSKSDREVPPTIEDVSFVPNSNFYQAEIPVRGSNIKEIKGNTDRIVEGIFDGSVPSTIMETSYGTKYLINSYAISRQYRGEPWVQFFVMNKDGKMLDIGSVPRKESYTDGPLSYDANALKRFKLPPETKVTPELRIKLKLFDPANNNFTVANEMKKNNATIVKVPLAFSPEVIEASKKGEQAVFFKAIFNENVWDSPSIKKITDLMVAGTKLPEAQAAVAAKNVYKVVRPPAPAPKKDMTDAEWKKAEEDFHTPNDDVWSTESVTNKMPPGFLAGKEEIASAKAEEDVLKQLEAQFKAELPFKNNPVVIATKKAISAPEKKEVKTVEARIGEENLNSKAIFQNKVTSKNVSTETDGFDIPTAETPKATEPEKNLSFKQWKGENGRVKLEEDLKINIKEEAPTLVLEHKGNDEEAFEVFLSKIEKGYKNMGEKSPFSNEKNKASLKALFKKDSQSAEHKIAKFEVKDGEVVVEPVLESSVKTPLEIETGFRPVKVNFSDNFEKFSKRMSKKDIAELLDSEGEKKGLVLMGAAGNKDSDFFFIKYDPSLIGGLSIEKGKDIFFKNVLEKVGISAGNSSDTVLNKRWKELLFGETRPVVNQKPYREIVVDFGKTPEGFVVNDGGNYMTAKAFEEIHSGGGYPEKIENFTQNKNVIFFKDSNKDLRIIKGETFRVSPESKERDIIEGIVRKSIPDYVWNDRDIIISKENYKVGKNVKDSIKQKGFYIGEIPAKSIYAKWDSGERAINDNAKFSPYLGAKMPWSPEFEKSTSKYFNETLKKYVDFFQDVVVKPKNADEALAALKKHSAFGKAEFGESAYGRTQRILKAQGWHDFVVKEIDSMMAASFRDHVLNGKSIKSIYGKLKPDLNFYKNPKTGVYEGLPDQTIMISEHTWKAQGKPDFALVPRHPSTKSSGVIPSKVIIAEDHGITDLGSSVVMNQKHVINDLQGDWDGDSVPVFWKSKEGIDGIDPVTYKLWEDIYNKHKGEKPRPLDDYTPGDLTRNHMIEMGIKSTEGNEAISQISSFRRTLQGIIDNDERVGGLKLQVPEGMDKDSWITEMKADIDFYGNAAVDSVKKKNLSEALAQYGDMTNLIATKYFGATKEYEVSKFIRGLSRLQPVFSYAKESYGRSFNEMIKDIGDYYKKVGANRKKPSYQDVLSKVVYENKDNIVLPDYHWRNKPPVERARLQEARQTLRVENYKKATEGIKRAPITDTKVKEFINFTRDVRKNTFTSLGESKKEDHNEIKANAREKIENFYEENKGSYSPEQKLSIIDWVMQSKEANLSDYNPSFINSSNRYQVRMNSIIADMPEITEPYFTADISSLSPKKLDPKEVVKMAEKLIPTKNNTITVDSGFGEPYELPISQVSKKLKELDQQAENASEKGDSAHIEVAEEIKAIENAMASKYPNLAKENKANEIALSHIPSAEKYKN